MTEHVCGSVYPLSGNGCTPCPYMPLLIVFVESIGGVPVCWRHFCVINTYTKEKIRYFTLEGGEFTRDQAVAYVTKIVDG